MQLYENIDIYLFDQLLKGRFDNSKKVLDAGCGEGRNLVYFSRNGFEVYGVDLNLEAIAAVQGLSQSLAPENPLTNFFVSSVEDLPFESASFDLAIFNAVLQL